ncbi:MAG TPA: hypothetical protein VFB63_21105 [Bryobacteraceae bacterium]|jgi:hypothetical protein|nr:hypothetical protein [Bryobacteraceae bacterium]
MSYIEYVTADHGAEDPMPELARTNGFTDVDLAQNRAGKISDKQMGRLFGRAFQPLRYPLTALFGWLLACLIVKTVVPGIILAIIAMLGGKLMTAIFGAITLGCVAAAFIAMLQSGRLTVLLIQDLREGAASFMDGRLSVSREEDEGLGLDKFHDRKRRRSHYVMNNEYFEVDEEAAAIVRDHPPAGRFRIYFAPRSKLLLSLELTPAK